MVLRQGPRYAEFRVLVKYRKENKGFNDYYFCFMKNKNIGRLQDQSVSEFRSVKQGYPVLLYSPVIHLMFRHGFPKGKFHPPQARSAYMQLTWLGHSCVLLSGSKKVLIDPFIEGGSVAGTQPDIVAITHGHDDHMGEAVALNKKTVAITEIAKYLKKKGLAAEGMNIGGTMTVDGVTFTMTPALHSTFIEEAGPGFSGGAAAGFVIGMDGVKVYHAGTPASSRT